MKLSKPVRILIGLGTAWFTIYPFLFVALWLSPFVGMSLTSQSSQGTPPFFMIPFFAIFPLHCLTVILQFVLMAFYLIHVIKNTCASETIRIILGVGVFFLPFIAMPIYYYLYIWRDQPPLWARRTDDAKNTATNSPMTRTSALAESMPIRLTASQPQPQSNVVTHTSHRMSKARHKLKTWQLAVMGGLFALDVILLISAVVVLLRLVR